MGVSVFFYNNDGSFNRLIDELRKNDEHVFFNIGTPFSLKVNEFYKRTRKKSFLCFFRTKEYISVFQKYLKCVEKLIVDKQKTYVLGDSALSFEAIEELLKYLLSEKKEYTILVVSIGNGSKDSEYYTNLDINNVKDFIDEFYRKNKQL